MGNWRTVHIVGTCAPHDVPALEQAITTDDEWSMFHCLSATPALCGLGMWAAERIDASGNLAERDYTVDDVVEVVRLLVGIAPSLAVAVHCGGEYEDPACVATITVRDGQVTVGPPAQPSVRSLPSETIMARLWEHLHPRTNERGAYATRILPDGRVLDVWPLLEGCAQLMISRDAVTQVGDELWDYTTPALAAAAMEAWDPVTEPEPSGWFRHRPSDRRRLDGDPAHEYVYP